MLFYQPISNLLNYRLQAVPPEQTRLCITSPLTSPDVLTLDIHDCLDTANSTTIIKIANDTVVVGLINHRQQ